MNREIFTRRLRDVFLNENIVIHDNFIQRADVTQHTNQKHTNDAFSEKWHKYERSDEKEGLFKFQLDWYLKLYGFDTEATLASYLASKNVIFDAGCGLGYKAAWFAKLAPRALVIGMDYSDLAPEKRTA
jgi:SAM-dependent methyltransferase